jgi:hypothetical protein
MQTSPDLLLEYKRRNPLPRPDGQESQGLQEEQVSNRSRVN